MPTTLRYTVTLSGDIASAKREPMIVDSTIGQPVTPEGTIDPAALPQICAEMNARDLVARRAEISATLSELADARPLLTYAEVTPDNCNIPDNAIRGEIARYMARFDRIDTSLLEEEIEGRHGTERCHNVELWEHVAGGCEPFEVREISKVAEDGEWAYDEQTVYQVVDTDNGDAVVAEFTDEDDAQSDMEERNNERREESLAGFPFAHTVGWEISSYDVPAFAAAGFLIWRYDGDKLIAGIDGGGYAMDGAHYAKAWWYNATHGYSGSLIETESGPRRAPHLGK